jgi:hypothetical protein
MTPRHEREQERLVSRPKLRLAMLHHGHEPIFVVLDVPDRVGAPDALKRQDFAAGWIAMAVRNNLWDSRKGGRRVTMKSAVTNGRPLCPCSLP